ncbi:unnamed protein product [Ambrosiozyma monospora]|uniref:Unnamed protein product n=1 Tax=Ambrosiozyma monospora TaxID=43982 RepID=A0ACB5U9A9_AMBMO|nr:unnamed protein product [Ambrosiozyma monospora]
MAHQRKNSNLDITLDKDTDYEQKLFRPKTQSLPKVGIRKLISNLRFKHLLVLSLVWLLTVHYFERTYVYSTIKKCAWSGWEDWPAGSDPHHSVVIGDPQIVDAFSYPDRPNIITRITQSLSDNYLHRNHVIYNKVLKPHTTLFVGDLFDGGREWEDDIWFEEYERFHEIFNEVDGNRVFKALPGNHDIGFGNTVKTPTYQRFKTFFGDVNDYVVLERAN